jgi:hypothetical protein
MTRLLDGLFSEGLETLVQLVRHADFTVELAKAIRTAENGVDRAVGALNREFFPTTETTTKSVDTSKNPFELSVEVQLAALRRANNEEGWGIPEEVFEMLAKTAPAWPNGRLAFRSLRVRFGEGDEGVALTFERHAKRIKTVFSEKRHWRWPNLRSTKQYLRLLVGDNTHHAVVEWITFDLNTNRERNSITAVRGPKSLADELFTFTWLFPDYIRSINYNDNPGLFAGGYELNVPEYDGEPWRRVPYVRWSRGHSQVYLIARWRSLDDSRYSVPPLRE